ncbi:MAG: PQQ-binding-like beta-propeller repeat protein [Nanoarchaeota archaeon]
MVHILKALIGKHEGRLNQSWVFDLGASLLCGPTVIDVNNDGHEEILIATKKGSIVLLDADAKQKWVFEINEKINDVDLMFMDAESFNSISTPPRIADINRDGKKEIIFGTELGIVYVLGADGKELWKFEADGAVRGGVAIADVDKDGKPELIFGSDDNKLYIISNKGNLLWSFNANTGIQSTPAVSERLGIIVFGDDQGKVNCVTFDRKLAWSFKTDAKITAEAVIQDLAGEKAESIIIGSTDNNLYCLDCNGNMKWVFKTQGAIISKALVYDINRDGKYEIFIGSCDNNVYALYYNGEKIWSFETNFWIVASPIAVDIDNDGSEEIVIGSYDHNIYVFDSEGKYILENIPGLSNVIHQAGHYADVQTQDMGENIGKKLWQFTTEGLVVGLDCLKSTKSIIVHTQTGKVINIRHES